MRKKIKFSDIMRNKICFEQPKPENAPKIMSYLSLLHSFGMKQNLKGYALNTSFENKKNY